MTIQKTPLDIALEYIAAGHSPIPIPHKAKVPNVRGWQKLRITREAAPQYFNGAEQNVGVLLGSASGGLTDVDLDCAEAVAVAPYFLPKTNAIFGRASRRGSHYLYKTALAAAGVTGRKVFKDPLTKSTLIELRTGAGDGTDGAMQTVFPGSTHESGEPIEWEPGANGEPAFVDGDELQSAEGKAAAAALLARYWPSGGRHDAALALGGMLARATWDEAGAKLFVEAVTRAAQDAEWKDRVRAIEDSYVRLGAGGNLQGLPSLKEQVGEQVATCVAEWLEIGGDHAQQSNLPTIRIKEGEIERIVDEMEEALIAQERGVYQRNAELVTIGEAKIVTASSGEVPAMRIFELPESAVAEHVCASANFLKFDARSKRDVVSDPPRKYITTLFERGPKLRVPVLAGISFVPILRRDGSIASSPGYDAITGLFFDPRGATFPEVAQHPSKDDAQGALDALNELIAECPFVADGDRAVAVSGILTAVIRRGLTAAPLHAFSSPVAGSGKSFLVDIAAAIATGREASVIAQGPNEEETEKRLGAVLRYGDPLISIDNCEKPLGGECLCQIATQPYVRARILGLSEMPELPGRTMLFATGNNLTVFGDMSRRTIMCSLDPKRERPELRHFARNPITMVKADRGRYVHASLTILRAYRLDEDAERPPALGSFEDWSSTVRGALMWLGMADPVATMEEVRTSDTKLEELALVLMNWEKVLGTKRTSVAEIIKTATEQHLGDFVYGDFRDALLAVAGTGSTINAKRLGRWIAKNKERLVEDRRICRDADFDKVAHWRLERREGV